MGQIIDRAGRGVIVHPTKRARTRADGSRTAGVSPRGDVLRVLLIEDNLDEARHFERLLETGEAACNVTRVGRVRDALRRLAAEDFDVILLDLCLPETDVADLVNRVQTAAPGMPIVLLTGRRDDPLAVRAIRGGGRRISSSEVATTPACWTDRCATPSSASGLTTRCGKVRIDYAAMR